MTANRSGYSRPEPAPMPADVADLVAAGWSIPELSSMARAIGRRAIRDDDAARLVESAGPTDDARDMRAEYVRLADGWRRAYGAFRSAAGIVENDR